MLSFRPFGCRGPEAAEGPGFHLEVLPELMPWMPIDTTSDMGIVKRCERYSCGLYLRTWRSVAAGTVQLRAVAI